jgi:amino acid adenylation domain-containing protein/non-ribosomal peptide synthase protein (TIGR01720 family)
MSLRAFSSSQPLAEAATLVDILKWRSDRQPLDDAFVFLADGEDDERPLTYRELDRRAQAVAGTLVEAGASGSRALLVYDSGLDYIAALYGCLYAGVIAVPVYPPDPFRADRTLPRLHSIVNDAGATWLLATEETLDWTRPLFSSVPGLSSSLATDPITKAAADGRLADRLPELEPGQPALLQYTSGSTGMPRGVTITHANLLANLRSIHAILDRDDQVAVIWLPAYHDMGLIGGIFLPVHSGRREIFMSPLSFMQRPARWLKAMSKYRATITAAPDFAYDLCVRKVSDDDRAELDLSSLATVLNGAEIVRPETLDRFCEAFAACGFRREAFYPCYGLAEATLMVAGGKPLQTPVVRSFLAGGLEQNQAVETSGGEARRLVGCGQAAPGTEVVVVEPQTCRLLDEGQVGEIWVSGGSVGQGYWNRPEESEETFGAQLDDGRGPFLRTGDLGFIDRGELFIAGRRKELIIIQGRNHYPHDIEETVWRSHPLLKGDGGAAFSLEVAGEERLGIVQEVIRPKKANPAELIELIRAQVTEVHGVSPVAVALIPAGTLPKTSSGKKKRRGCRDQFLSGSLSTIGQWRDAAVFADGQQPKREAVGPRTETERKLAAVWSDVLGVKAPDVHANFFDLGGQSLLAAQLAARIQETFAVELPLRTLFAKPTIAQLAAWLDQPEERRSGDALPPVTRADRSQPLPLSSSQEQLWFLEQFERLPRYNLTARIRLHGPLDVAALRRSLSAIANRHEALRTSFPANDGRPTQRIAEPRDVPLVILGTTSDVAPAVQKFNLATGPLLWATLERISEVEHRLTIVAHHLICDGWSLTIFLREVAAFYAAAAGQGSPSAQSQILDDLSWHYADFAVWQQSCLATPQLARELAYWKRQLEGVKPLDLVTDYQRLPDGAFRGGAVNWAIERPLAEGLVELAHREGATLYMVLLAAFQTLLARYSRQLDVCVGSPVSYRPRREFEGAIGYFVNTLALRCDLTGEPTFRELLGRVRETVLDALANGDAPLPSVVDAVSPQREAGRTPLFNVMFVFENLSWQGVQVGGLSLGEIEIDHTRIGSYDLGLVVEEQAECLKASLVFNAALFDRATIENMAGAFGALLAGVVGDADRPVMRLPLGAETRGQGDKETRGIAEGAAVPATLSLSPCPLVSVSSEHPSDVAIVDEATHVTYGELEQRSNQLARYLQTLGVEAEHPVAIYLDRSVELIVALLAVLKAGGAYVPFDANEAAGRLEVMLADIEPQVIITHSRLVQHLPPHSAREIVLDRDEAQFARHPLTSPVHTASPDSLAYIVYTSGSSGKPKGVEVTRASLDNLVRAMAEVYELTPRDRVLQLISPAFDVAAEEIFPALLRGATLVLAPPTPDLTGRTILDVCRRERITVAHVPPQLWQQCLREWRPDDESLFEHLRVLVHGGEPYSAEALNHWLRLAHGRVRMLYEFGLTETTVTNLIYELPGNLTSWPAGRRLPIGRPVAGCEVQLLDGYRQPVPIGAPGELYLGGPGLARGYHRLPEATNERFVEMQASELDSVRNALRGSVGNALRGVPSAATQQARVGIAHHESDGGQCPPYKPPSYPLRLCRTGDLARQLPDGNVEFLGRLDKQIKLRGLRIEPGEIERVLTQHRTIREAAVVAREDVPGVKRLVAYFVPVDGYVPDGDELRGWLRDKLPDSMLPAIFMPIEGLPLNRRSQKIDYDALPAPPTEVARREYTAPRNEAEQILAKVWQEVLKVERVGIHDNFFELGGDSILTIQVVARAREAGLRFTPRQIFEHQTIADLAAIEGHVAEGAAEQGPVVGDVPLTPAQQWFLSDDVVDPHHFNQALLLRVDASLDPQHLPQVLQRLIEQHDALRLRFARDAQGWRQWHSTDADWPLERFDLSATPAAERVADLTTAATALQASLDLEHGPVARAGWFDLGGGETRLLLVVHHLVVDAVSWRVLLDDLTTIWNELQSGQPPALPAKTTSFQHWAERLVGYAQSFETESELSLWRALAEPRPAALPRDAAGVNQHGDADVLSTTWSAADSSVLLGEANRAYRTQPNELLLAALADAMSEWSGGQLLIDVEGHGRAELFDDVDLSRTVGWFTSWHPHRSAPAGLPPGTLLRQTKEALRGVPNQGLAFGVLRYLSANPEVRSTMAALPPAEVSFNYLGRLDDHLSPLLAPADEPIGPTRSHRAPRHHLLEINAYVLDGCLHVDWTYSRNLHRRDTIDRLARDFRERLAALIAHCLSPEAGGFTPSDFPLARLDQAELDKLANLLGE